MKGVRIFNVRLACQILGFSRQAYYRLSVEKPSLTNLAALVADAEIKKARIKCPSTGCRSMYENFGDKLPIGRDKSIKLFMDMGYRVRFPKRYGRATQSGTREFSNLLVEKDLDAINQVWQGDMAHYLYGEKKMYTIYITDVYSQEIVGHGSFDTNEAINYAKVLRDAIQKAKSKGQSIKGLIHHSDGGKQYESIIYKTLCEKNNIKQSMCMYSYENPYAEKTNDLINNGYLNIWRPRSLQNLIKYQNRAVKDHNSNRKKKILNKMSPIDFRNQLVMGKEVIHNYVLKLKPRMPEQPRRKIQLNEESKPDTRH
ncbi:DDE-type integrase/transposase/recombinase [Belliella aquatica]|uniref:Transposase n=2 Tax=Belliella aquatica TaxID=1323734 RepID=A0ABQ1NA15_9BACT|nr:DDE-type integrase/transposase/recombinase [Belliella aquatica]MCH7407733.1 DDE-type integrase/transposase/recombinase [Belliella aquatica]GGC55668.1 transposase [Belliella aquatica]